MIPTLFLRIKGKFQNIGANWDKLAPTKEQAIDYAHTHINQEPEQMIDANIHSMEYSLARYGGSINDRYRQGRVNNSDLEIAAMVAEHTTDTDLILYRGVCNGVYNLMVQNAKDIPDCDLLEEGFLATSLVKGHEINSEIKLRIYVPAGTKCVYLGNVNEEQDSYEVVVMHSSKLKIISIDNEYINCRLIATA